MFYEPASEAFSFLLRKNFTARFDVLTVTAVISYYEKRQKDVPVSRRHCNCNCLKNKRSKFESSRDVRFLVKTKQRRCVNALHRQYVTMYNTLVKTEGMYVLAKNILKKELLCLVRRWVDLISW
jgi:hypothetical protein